MAAAAREWGAALGACLALPVTMRDERLSSSEAERRLGRMPRGRSGGPPTRTERNAFRARIDREAASVILQDELDARRAGVAPSQATRRGSGCPTWFRVLASRTAIEGAAMSVSGAGAVRARTWRCRPRMGEARCPTGTSAPGATAGDRATSVATTATATGAAGSVGSSASPVPGRAGRCRAGRAVDIRPAHRAARGGPLGRGQPGCPADRLRPGSRPRGPGRLVDPTRRGWCDRGRVHGRVSRHTNHPAPRLAEAGIIIRSGPSCSRPASTSSPRSSRRGATPWP